jgi:L-lysine exporter family protein LysE/ArgO
MSSLASAAFVQGFAMMAGLIVAIGAQNAQVLRLGLARSHVGVVVAFCTLSDWLLVVLGVFGFGSLLAASPLALQAMRYAGALFLFWCGLRAAGRVWRGTMALSSSPGALRWSQALGTTAALTWLNPHVYLDTVVLLGSVGAQQPAALRGVFALGAGVASMGWFSLLGFGAAALGARLSRPGTWRAIDAVVAIVMVVVGLQLLQAGR